MKIIPLSLSLAAMCYVQAARAEVEFSMPASACVPNSATIRDDRALVGNASVRHAADNVDLIVLTCPITPFNPMTNTDWTLRVTYVDSTGTGGGSRVLVRLYRMTVGDNTPVVVATMNSNLENETGLNTIIESFTHSFEFAGSIYWIHAELSRTNTSHTAILHSIMLRDAADSDIRLKHSIALLGRLDNGLGFYRFSYRGSDKAYVGVMAQEVAAIRPDAVVPGGDGYLRVSYGSLGLRLQSYEEWVVSGEKIPTGDAAVR